VDYLTLHNITSLMVYNTYQGWMAVDGIFAAESLIHL